MLEEAPVLDGDDGLDHARRDLLEGDEPALGAILVFREGGDQLGLELVGLERRAVVGRDADDLVAVGSDGCAVGGVERLRPGLDEDGVWTQVEGAELGVGVVAGGAEVGGDRRDGALLADADLLRGRIDLRDGSEHRSGCEPLIHDVLVLAVEVEKDAGSSDDGEEDKHHNKPENAGDETGLRFAGTEFYFDWHGGVPRVFEDPG